MPLPLELTELFLPAPQGGGLRVSYGLPFLRQGWMGPGAYENDTGGSILLLTHWGGGRRLSCPCV